MQRILQAQSGLALLRGFFLAAFAFVAGGIRHGVGFVEDDDAIKTCPGPRAGVAAEPVDDLLHAAGLPTTRLGAQGRVSRKEDPFVERDRSALTKAR